MLEMSRCLYTGGNFKQNVGKIDRKLVTLFMIMIYQFTDLVPTSLFADLLYDHCSHDLRLCSRKMLTNGEMAYFQKSDFLRFFPYILTIILVMLEALYVPIEYTFCFICSEKCIRNNSSRTYIDLF